MFFILPAGEENSDIINWLMMDKLISGATKLGLKLSPRQLEQFRILYQELVDWNQKLNLTTITGYEDVQTKHFLDSLTVTLVWYPPPGESVQVIDVGTGAGIPGIPLKILVPDIKLVLLDATAKKAAFLQHLIPALNLNGVEVVIGRAEEVAHQPQYREKFNVVLSRAVAPLPTLVELVLPFCAIDGKFIAHKKGTITPETTRADKAIATLGGKLREVKRVNLDEFSDERYLIVIDKVLPTPEVYPRRPGIPAKRPLGAKVAPGKGNVPPSV